MEMAKSTSITLGDHFDTFIAKKLKEGSYRNASELIREGLRKIEEEDLKLTALRKMLDRGRKDLEEGRFKTYHSIDELRVDINKELEARKSK